MQHLAAKGWVCVAINYRLAPTRPLPRADHRRQAGDRLDQGEHRGVRRRPRLPRDHRRLRRRPPRRPGGADRRTTRRSSPASRTPTRRCRRRPVLRRLRPGRLDRAEERARQLRDRLPGPAGPCRPPGPSTPSSSRRPRPSLRITPDAPDFFVLHGTNDTPGPGRAGPALRGEAARDLQGDGHLRRAPRRPARLRRVPVDPVSHHVVRAVDRYLHWHWNQYRREHARARHDSPEGAEPARAQPRGRPRIRSPDDVAQDLGGAAGDREAPGVEQLPAPPRCDVVVRCHDPVAVELDAPARRCPAGCVRRAAWPRSTPRPGPGRPASAASSRTPSSVHTVDSATAWPTATRWAAVRSSAAARATARSVLLSSRLVAIATRSLASVVRASFQPSSDLADQAVVGHEHVVQEHLVEHRVAGELAQRPHVDAGGLHVDEEVADALVLRHVRVGAGQADAPVGALGDASSTPSGR